MDASSSEEARAADPVSRRVVGCAFRVSRVLGAGFLESVYENALCVELAVEGIHFEQQKPLVVHYLDRVVVSFVAEERLLVELKALRSLTSEHEAQVMNYLRASGLTVGLLLNFGTPRLEVRRIVWGHVDSDPV